VPVFLQSAIIQKYEDLAFQPEKALHFGMDLHQGCLEGVRTDGTPFFFEFFHPDEGGRLLWGMFGEGFLQGR
jgi:hypothetical protein